MSNLWIYRAGVWSYQLDGRRACFGETWISTTAPSSDANTLTDIDFFSGKYFANNTMSDEWSLPGWQRFAEEVYPRRHSFRPMWTSRSGGPRVLNVNAPEAAWRLQRVGAGGVLIGTVAPPIFTDSSFTDMPHRRRAHATFPPIWAWYAPYRDAFNNYVGVGGRAYVCACVTRSTMTWEPVVAYNLASSVMRRWRRNRPITPGPLPPERRVWVPPQYTWLTR